MAARIAISLVFLCFALGCSGEPDVATPPPGSPAPADISGTWHVEGVTQVIGSEVSREIAGTVVFRTEGESYTVSFELETLFPGPDGALPAEVVGTGTGSLSRGILEGTARTQIVASRIPGIDSSFILVPPAFGVRIESSSVGTLNDDGSLSIVLVNRPAEGESYRPTRTTVRGVRAEAD